MGQKSWDFLVRVGVNSVIKFESLFTDPFLHKFKSMGTLNPWEGKQRAVLK